MQCQQQGLYRPIGRDKAHPGQFQRKLESAALGGILTHHIFHRRRMMDVTGNIGGVWGCGGGGGGGG